MTLRVSADAGMRRLDGGRIVLGGAPLRLFRLSPAGAARLDGWLDGEPVSERPADRRLARRLLEAGVVHPACGADSDGCASEVTLVVPVHDRPDRLARLLDDTGSAVDAIVIVDDASPDAQGIAEVACRSGATLLRQPRRSGPAAARNRGWRAAGTDLVLFVDSDCHRPRPGPAGEWLARLRGQMAAPDVGIVAPRITAPDGCAVSDGGIRTEDALVAYERDRSPLDQGPSPARVHPNGRVRYVPAAALLVRRSVLDALGGFDESLEVGEDVDLVWRADSSGYRVRYDPSVAFSHDVRPDMRSWLAQRYRYGTSAAQLDRRHPGAVAPAAVGWPVALAWTLAVAGKPRAALAVTAVNVARARRLFTALEAPPPGWRAEAARLAVQGHLGGGRLLADALRRAWWPLLVPASATRIGRRVAAAAVLTAAWEAVSATGGGGRGARSGRAAAQSLALRLADDLAYGVGVWAGALRDRRLGALLPRLTR